MSGGAALAPGGRLSRSAGERRGEAEVGEAGWPAAACRDAAVHDAVRLLGLEPAAESASGYDARGPEGRYRIAGCLAADVLVAPRAFPAGGWDRALLVSFGPELEPLAIHELTREAAALAGRSAAALRAGGRRRWAPGGGAGG